MTEISLASRGSPENFVQIFLQPLVCHMDLNLVRRIEDSTRVDR